MVHAEKDNIMGLDMYLTKKVYVGAEWEHRNVTGKISIKVDNEPLPINFKKVAYIEENAGYWRKANQIHRWFVENVQDGKDDCGDYHVPRESMKALLDLCNRVIDASVLVDGQIHDGTSWDKDGKHEHWVNGKIIQDPSVARALLPTQEGFFFGGTDYDEYYLQDIKDTRDILTEALKDEGGEYHYSSSW